MFTKKDKGIKIILILLMILALGGAGIYYYVMNNFDTKAFIRKNATLIKAAVNIVDFTTPESSDILKDNYTFEGNYKLNTTSSELSFLNNIELNVKSDISVENEYLESDVSLKQDDAELSLSAFMESSRAYFSSKEIYQNLLSYDTKHNIFKDIKDSVNDDSKMSKEDINYIINKSVDYFVEALDEADMTTKYNGLTAEYKIVITKDQARRIKDRFETLVKKDEKLSKYYNFVEKETNNITDIETKEMTIIIRQNMINRLIEGFEVSDGDKKLIGEKDASGNFNVKEDGKVVLTIKKIAHGFETEMFNNDKSAGKLSVTANGKNINIDIKDETSKTEVKLMLKGNNNELGIDSEIITTEMTIKSNVTIKEEKELTKVNGNINVKIGNNDVTLTFTQSYGKTKETLSKKMHTGATNLEYLEENEKNEIMTNFQTAISKFKFYNYFISSLSNIGNQAISNDNL